MTRHGHWTRHQGDDVRRATVRGEENGIERGELVHWSIADIVSFVYGVTMKAHKCDRLKRVEGEILELARL